MSTAASSIRWKTKIQPIEHAVEKVSALRGVYFDWNKDRGGRHDIGMIAEEVGKVIPEIVQYEPNGVDATGMDYSRLSALLVEAVKELQAQLNKLITENQALTQRIKALEQR